MVYADVIPNGTNSRAQRDGDPAVYIDKVTKRYGEFTAVDNIDLTINEGEFLTLLGPSGSGKTTTLQMIAGFESLTSGDISIHGKSMRGVKPHHRNIGMVFQSYSLFPHMSVFDNIAFPLRIRRRSRSVIRERVAEVLNIVNLDDFSHRKPQELSGGQRQRVALARAFVYEPELLLMDEPLSALDKKLREQLQSELRRIHRTLGVTVVFVTHDQEEALRLSDRIAVFNNGKIVQCGSGEALYDGPCNQFVASFLGNGNVLAGEVDQKSGETATIRLKCGRLVNVPFDRLNRIDAGEEVNLFVRPEHMHIMQGGIDGQVKNSNYIPAKVIERIFVGGSVSIRAESESGEDIEINAGLAHSTDAMAVKVNDSIVVQWDCDQTQAFTT